MIFLGVGKEAIATVFWGSGFMPLSEMRKPAKGISELVSEFADVAKIVVEDFEIFGSFESWEQN